MDRLPGLWLSAGLIGLWLSACLMAHLTETDTTTRLTLFAGPLAQLDDSIFFLQHRDNFLQAASAFSKFRPGVCTYCSKPDSCRLADGTAPFDPIECKQCLLDVSCVSMHSRCTTSHMAHACTLIFFEIRGRTVQPRLSRFGLSNLNV